MVARFLSSPIIIRVPVFLLFGFNNGTLEWKGQKRVRLRNLGSLNACFAFGFWAPAAKMLPEKGSDAPFRNLTYGSPSKGTLF